VLIVKKTVRLEHPNEAGAWFDLSLPLSAGDMELMRNGALVGMVSIDLLTAVLSAWSYAAPVTVENVKALDLDTFTWLAGELQERSGILDESEKKSSSSNSPATSVPATAGSQPSLGT
jgi:hypothetical protein